MKFKRLPRNNGSNIIDAYYEQVKAFISNGSRSIEPFLRRFQRFLALPYAYFVLVNWQECKASLFQVFKDFLYIFFILNDFPDYYTQLRWWEVDRQEWKYYYGSFYNPYQRGRLRLEVQKKEYEILFSDKYICHQLCQSANLPEAEFLAYLEPRDNYKSRINDLVNHYQQVIIKSTRGKGGKEISLAYLKEGRVVIDDRMHLCDLQDFKLCFTSIVQKYVVQHEELAKISRSVNTIRTETLLTTDGKVILLGAFMRFGRKSSFVDNLSSGGLSIGIDLKQGQLKEYALDGKGEKYYTHPDSGFTFKNYKIPYWQEVVELSKKIQLSFPYYKLLGPDIAITTQGPIIIEINATPDHAVLEMDYGPTLKDENVRREFNRYNLLINRSIKKEIS
jgi:hypothetical protein